MVADQHHERAPLGHRQPVSDHLVTASVALLQQRLVRARPLGVEARIGGVEHVPELVLDRVGSLDHREQQVPVALREQVRGGDLLLADHLVRLLEKRPALEAVGVGVGAVAAGQRLQLCLQLPRPRVVDRLTGREHAARERAAAQLGGRERDRHRHHVRHFAGVVGQFPQLAALGRARRDELLLARCAGLPEVEDAVAAGVLAGRDRHPRGRAVRRQARLEAAVAAGSQGLCQVGHHPPLGEWAQQVPGGAVEAENDRSAGQVGGHRAGTLPAVRGADRRSG